MTSTGFGRLFLLLFSILAGISLSAPARGGDIKILAGHLLVTGHAKLFVAKEHGFFSDEGLDVELIDFSNSPDGMAALRAGKLDVGAFGTVAPLAYIAAGFDIRIIAGIMGEDAYIVARPAVSEKIRTPADMRGMRIASVTLSSGDAVLRGVLRQAGLSLTKDVSFLTLSTPRAVLDAVGRNHADVGVIWGPYDADALREGLRMVFSTADLFPGHPCCRLVTTGDRFESKRRVWPKFIRALLRAEQFISNDGNRDKTVEYVSRYVKMSEEEIRRAFFQSRLDQSSDLNVDAILKFWEIVNDAELVHPSNAEPARFIEVEPYLDALHSLVASFPSDLFWQLRLSLFAGRNSGSIGGGGRGDK